MDTRQSHEVGATGRPADLSNASSGEIRNEIRHTRAEMDETVDELSERLRPRHLLDDLLDVFRTKAGRTDAEVTQSVKDLGSGMFDKLKSHPMPAALIGAGVAWLIFDQARGDGNGGSSYDRARGRWREGELREHSGSFVDARTGRPYDSSYGSEFRGRSGQGEGGSGSESGPGFMDKAKEKLSDMGRSVSDATSSAVDSVRDAAGSVRDSISGAGSAAGEMGGRAGAWSAEAYDSARHGMRQGYDSTVRTLEESLNRYPLAMTAAALAAGVLTGLVLPETRRENRWMGEQSDRLKEQAKETGEDLLERGKEVAAATASAVSGEAEQQGLTPGSLADKSKKVVRDTVSAAKESVHREGMDDIGQKAKSVAKRGKEVAKDEASRQKDQLS